MAPLQQPLGRGADLLGLLQLAGRYAQLQFLQRLPRPLHRLHPHGLLVGAALVGIDDDHPHAGDPRGNFLSPGARRIDLLSRRDPHRAIDPLGLINGGQPLIQLFVPPPLQAHQIAVIPRGDRIKIITSDHTSIADEDQAVEPESLVQVGDGLADGGVVHFVAGPDVMRDRPAGHHHHGNDHLDVVRLAIAAVAVLGEVGRPGALEVGAGDVIEHQVRLEAEQVAEVMIEGHLDLLLGRHELIESAVPGLELLEVDPDSLVLVPVGHEPAAPAIAEEVGLQPAGQAMFAGGADEPIGDQDERPVGERHTLGLTERRVEDGPQPELVEQGADGEDRPPGGGVEDVGVFGLTGVGSIPAKEPLEFG